MIVKENALVLGHFSPLVWPTKIQNPALTIPLIPSNNGESRRDHSYTILPYEIELWSVTFTPNE